MRNRVKKFDMVSKIFNEEFICLTYKDTTT